MFPHTLRATAPRAAATATLAVLLAACGSDDNPQAQRGGVLSDAAVATLTKQQIDAGSAAIRPLTGAARCDVTVRKVVHTTSGPDGGTGYSAVAAVLVPVASDTCAGPFPMVAYKPGTSVEKARSLANPTSSETALLTAFFAAQGYVVVATDYLGFSDSSFAYHPYLHAESQAATTVDAIRAARFVLERQRVPSSGKLFLTGYSQGGHAAMATHRAIEADPSLGLTVTAAGPMSGPYNLTGSFTAGLGFLPTGTGGSSVFTPYVVTTYQKVYRNIYSTPSDYFQAPYASGIESLLPGASSFEQLYATGKLPVNLGDLLTPRAIADVGDPTSGLGRALAANTLLGWTPKAPVMLCAGAKDPVVLYAVNTAVSAADLRGRGASVVEVDVEQVPELAPVLATLTPQTYHGGVIVPCLKMVRDGLFASLR
jgi:pimeloyl-ACP methyl ester carboxylesterase